MITNAYNIRVVVIPAPLTSPENSEDKAAIKERELSSSEYSWQTFVIPWEKIPPFMLKQCEEGKISKSALTEIVHIIVNEMRNVREYIPYKAFRIVAKKISDKYPAAFIDKDEDSTVLGDGMHGIVSKMRI